MRRFLYVILTVELISAIGCASTRDPRKATYPAGPTPETPTSDRQYSYPEVDGFADPEDGSVRPSVGSGSDQGSLTPPPSVVIPANRMTSSGTAQVTKNDIGRAREQALAAAMRSAVEQAARVLAGKDTVPADILAKARRYVSRYSVKSETPEPDVSYSVEIEADIDVAALRRDLDSQTSNVSAITIEVIVLNARRARDFRDVANTLRADSRVRDIRQQSYKTTRAVLEVDILGIAEDIAPLLTDLTTDDGAYLLVDKVDERTITTSWKYPK